MLRRRPRVRRQLAPQLLRARLRVDARDELGRLRVQLERAAVTGVRLELRGRLLAAVGISLPGDMVTEITVVVGGLAAIASMFMPEKGPSE